jgi:hypothetical protein
MILMKKILLTLIALCATVGIVVADHHKTGDQLRRGSDDPEGMDRYLGYGWLHENLGDLF